MKKLSTFHALVVVILFGLEMLPLSSMASMTRVWWQIPFYPLGDWGQYEETSSQMRSGTLDAYFSRLVTATERLAQAGGIPEGVLPLLMEALLTFDQLYDLHKKTDVTGVGSTLEAQFKAELDELYRAWSIPDKDRQFIFASPRESLLIHRFLDLMRQGHKLSSTQLPRELSQIRYLMYGTFSNLGKGQFLVTLHVTDLGQGRAESFSVTAPLRLATRALANKLFDWAQNQVDRRWQLEDPARKRWITPPADWVVSYQEARLFCESQKARLPYARELMEALFGGPYRPGGVGPIKSGASYFVQDQRVWAGPHVFLTQDSVSLRVQAAGEGIKASFFCVQGPVDQRTTQIQKLWSLIRQHQSNEKLWQALHSLRFHWGDLDASAEIRWGTQYKRLELLDENRALEILRELGVKL